MINPKQFYDSLIKNGIDFFTGVPDSLLKNICAYITDNVSKDSHVIAANEGGAIALGAGYHLATGKIPLVYMQNSGIGNAVNPLLSLVDKSVYNIPILLLIGWRGEPSTNDEPQHIKQGAVTTDLLEVMDIPYEIIPDNYEKVNDIVSKSLKYVEKSNKPFALVIKKDTFEPYKLQNTIKTNFEMTREDAIKIIVNSMGKDDIIISTTGKTSRELFEYREKLAHCHNNDFLTVGSMGHASQIALGIAMQKPLKQIYCFDGDGAIIMHTSSLGIIGSVAPKNFKHIVFNNGSHDSVGGQPTIGFDIDFSQLANTYNYKSVFITESKKGLENTLAKFNKIEGPSFLEIRINKGARKELGRPTTNPIENKTSLMKILL